MRPPGIQRRLLVVGLSLVCLGAACSKGKPPKGGASTATADAQAPGTGAVTIIQEAQASWIRNFNPLLAPSTSRWPTRAGIYEPLLIYNTLKAEYVPWLARTYAWSEGNTKLSFTVRPGVKWSDGRPFTARDVAFTFGLLREHKALDLSSVWTFLSGVRARDDATVEFTLSRPFVPGLLYIAQQPIVPEHAWKDVADPVTYKNEQPVATGPFTRITLFQNQVWELGRNPHYWQEGKPAVERLRFPAYPGNDQANLALLGGGVDYAGIFVPDIERLFVSKDPEHNHYWFPLVGNTVMLYANTTREPFDDVRVRKALSMAIDRPQLVKVAMYGYTRPSDATGLSETHDRWRDPGAVEAGGWVKLDPDKANALLDAAGYARGGDGVRAGPDKKPLRFDIHVVTGWSDWVRAAQIIARNLKAVGIDATLKTYDFSPFFEKAQKGEFDLTLGWSSDEPSPYYVYRDLVGSETERPVGELSSRNWHRFGSPDADALLRAFEATSDPAEQHRLSGELQRLFVENAPCIPLFPGPSWGEYSTRRFTGFPNKDNPYAKLSPNAPPESLLVLIGISPR